MTAANGLRSRRRAWLRRTVRVGVAVAAVVALWELPWFPHSPRCVAHEYEEPDDPQPEWLSRNFFDNFWYRLDGSLSEPYAKNFTGLLRSWNTTALPHVRHVRLGRLVLLRPVDELEDPTDMVLNGSFKTLRALGNPEWNEGWPDYSVGKRAAIRAFADRGEDGRGCPFARVLAIHDYVP